MRKSVINKFISYFKTIFEQLKVNIANENLEEIACFVHHCMQEERRKFHTPRHVFTVAKGLEHPIQVLAILFHDIIYYQIDDGFPPDALLIIQDFIEEKDGQVFIKTDFPEDIIFKICLDIFKFKAGEQLSPYGGLNEFLSAFIAGKSLENHLVITNVVGVLACIEATIPFRLLNTESRTNFEELAHRLKEINSKYEFSYTDEEIDDIVKLSVEVANKDVENFSDEDTGRFLDNTWLLLSESNKTLTVLEDYAYSIAEYREAIMKTEVFLSFLKPASIFHEYKGVPDAIHFQKISQQAHKNIMIAREYLGVKLLAMTILEALAECTGGRYVPVSMFTGAIRNNQNMDVERAEDFLPPLPDNNIHQCHPVVLNLLEYGRSSETSFDMRHSPLSAFFYQHLGSEKTKQYLAYAKELFAEQITYKEFLDQIDKQLLGAFAKACSELAITRRERLSQFF